MLVDDLARELNGLYEQPICNLVDEVNLRRTARGREAVTAREIVEIIAVEDSNSPAVRAFQMALRFWDVDDDSRLTASKGTHERRTQVLGELGLSEFKAAINDVYPVTGARHYVISSKPIWQQWYTPSIGSQLYWREYVKTLRGKGLSEDEVGELSRSVDDIMRRISAPFSEDPYQSKGLVVGHVQSGKTSHFAGLIAKAISSGYKLIIVLTGTIEMLRAQTQRRLDMELIGKENILQGRSEDDPDVLKDVDYVLDDPDWKKFVSFGDISEDPLAPGIIRLTTHSSDFRSLRQGLEALDFQKDKKHRGLPIFAQENLTGMPVRMLVLKKNSTNLQKVIRDLKSIHSNLQEVPALLIDDEADQASPNTRKNSPSPEPGDEDKKERTAINRHISTLLQLMPRAQYVGYTATPFANVFIEPDDYEDIFPKDFIVSLEPSNAYLGSHHFHDIEIDLERDKSDLSTSNEAAFARRVFARDDESERREIMRALDSFVLTGAIKKYRQDLGILGDYKHHTMLAHTSAFKATHSELKTLVDEAWAQGAYHSPETVSRLWSLLEDDFLALDKARNWNHAFPNDKKGLSDCIGAAIAEIQKNHSPAVIVNSDKDLESSPLDFIAGPQWRVVIGGAKLSRGFTIEGLTISYFRRRSSTQDALMQMGRWFGYRPGYGDLVRLFIGAAEKQGSQEIDLYDAFTATVRDEEDFRQQLKIYSELSSEDGTPEVTPFEVPPLVYQHFGWLRPTSRNKMHNVELSYEGYSEKFIEKARHLPYSPDTNTRNFKLFQDKLLPNLDQTGKFLDADGRRIDALYGIAPAFDVFSFSQEFEYSGDTLKPTAAFIKSSIENGTIEDFFIMIHFPNIEKVEYRDIPGASLALPIVRRSRRENYGGRFVGTEKRSRRPLDAVSGRKPETADPLADSLRNPTRASMLIEIVGENPHWKPEEHFAQPSQLAVLFGYVFPFESAPNKGRMAFRARTP